MKKTAKKTTTRKPVLKRTAKPAAAQSPETVLVLKTVRDDMTAHNGFKWPEAGPVECPDWKPTKECGNGLHGWLWGAGDWSLKIAGATRWLVIEVEKTTIIDLDGKVKFPRGVVRAVCSNWQDAMAIIRPKMPVATGNIASGYSGHAAASGDSGHAAASGGSGHAAASGNYGHAAASGNYGHAAASGNYGHAAASGYSGHAAASGDSGHAAASGYSGHAAASGDSGHAAASGYSGHAAASGYSGHAAASGYSGHAAASGGSGHAAASGDSGHAAASGYSGHAAASGKGGWAIAGLAGFVKAGPNGAITALWSDTKRKRVIVGYVGEDGIEAGRWYSVEVTAGAARFVPATVDCAHCNQAAK